MDKKPNGTILTVPNGFGWKVIFVPYSESEKKEKKEKDKTNG